MSYFEQTYAGNIFRFTKKMAEEGNVEAQHVNEVARDWVDLLSKKEVSCDEIRRLLHRAKKIENLCRWGGEVYSSIKYWHRSDCILPKLPSATAFDFPVRHANQTYLLMEPIQETHKITGHNRFALVTVRLEPFLDRRQFAIEWKPNEEKIPKSFMPHVFHGIRQACFEEFEKNKQVFHVKITVDADYHEVDSNHRYYQIAGYYAYKNALAQAILEKL